MSAGGQGAKVPDAIGPIDIALLAAPIDFLAAEVNRQRAALTLLESIARGLPAAARVRLAPALQGYFHNDLTQHLADEADSLLPLLRGRAAPDDGFEQIANAIATERSALEAETAPVMRDLGRIGSAREDVLDGFRETVARFSRSRRDRIAWEMSTLLPLARARLKPTDLRRLTAAMARRRGLSAQLQPDRWDT